jgi:hypothetical protein
LSVSDETLSEPVSEVSRPATLITGITPVPTRRMPRKNVEEYNRYMRDYRKGVVRKMPEADLRLAQRKALEERDGKVACATCHIDIPEVIAVHHVDHDRGNNDLSNLKFLCFNCHFLHHNHPEAVVKVQDWASRRMDTKLFEKLLKAVRTTASPNQRACIFHRGRPSVVTVGFDPATGKELEESKMFGVCRQCWKLIAEG